MSNRKEMLKELIKSLHEGADPEQVKEQFKSLLEGVTPVEIARVEEELINEGLPREEIHRLCDVHLAIFRESLEQGAQLAPAGHPIHILMEEHKAILRLAGELADAAREVRERGLGDEQRARLAHIKSYLEQSESHYVREENVLFPYLERHGISQPPAIMWMEHDRIRGVKKEIYSLLEGMTEADWGRLRELAVTINELLQDHFQKENKVLFPAALRVMDDAEWTDARQQFDELGYCPFTPEQARVPFGKAVAAEEAPQLAGRLRFGTGSLTPVELEAMLNTLPVEITFVDANDQVRYFNQTAERIFPRTRAALGRQVQRCHPQKSVHLVNRILDDFRNGRRDVAEFWIQLKGRFIHIRYFAVRSPEGEYLGAMEVAQDLTRLRELEGERRLLDEEG